LAKKKLEGKLFCISMHKNTVVSLFGYAQKHWCLFVLVACDQLT